MAKCFAKKVPFILLIFLTLVIAVIGFSWNFMVSDSAIWDGTADTDWYSEDEMEFTITTAEQLGGLADLVNTGNDFFGKTVKLGQNIKLNDTANWQNWESSPPANEWVPIGGFQGVFDGNGFAINGVYINSSDNYQGLFMNTSYGAVIKNLGVAASYIKGGECVGGLIGESSESIIRNSYFIGAVTGEGMVGGLIGYSYDSEISNSYSIGTVTGEYAGGLVGWNNASWDAALLTGDEDERWVDWLNNSSIKMNRGVINNSYFAGASSGGLVGYHYYGAIINSYYNEENMQSKEFADDLNLAASFLKMNAWIYSEGNYPVLSNQTIEVGIDNLFASGDGTEMNPYIIYTKKQLEDFSKLVNFGMDFSNKYLKLGASIAFNDTANWQNWANEPPANEWMPIGISSYLFTTLFKGAFDGNGFAISGIYVNSKRDYQGLFAEFKGTIKNLGVTASYVKGDSHIGGLAGENRGEISNSYYIGDVAGYPESHRGHWAGGLVGKNFGPISNSYSAGTVSGGWEVGGLVGLNYGKINNSYSAAKVTGGKYDIGGLVGENRKGTIRNSYSTGLVKGTEIFGGLVGRNDEGTTINSYYDKETSGQNDKGKGYGMGKTTKAMKEKATFAEWDFDSVWKIDAETNGGYPYLY